MAVEAFSLGASVVAFIALAGQLAQGCRFAARSFDDYQHAPVDLHALRRQTKLFEVTLDSFQDALRRADEMGIAGTYSVLIAQALEYSKETVTDLLTSLNRIQCSKGAWSRTRFVFAKDGYSKLSGRVQYAKGLLAIAQGEMIL